MKNAGERTIDWLYNKQFKLNNQRSIRKPNGFIWWADRNAQTIEITGKETGPDGEQGYFISIRTELLRSFELHEENLNFLNHRLMRIASLCGPVYYERDKTLSLVTNIRVYDGISKWMNEIIKFAALIQIGEAQRINAQLVKHIHAEKAFSEPPSLQLKLQPHECIGFIESEIVPAGKQPSHWVEDEFQQTVDQWMQGPPSLLASSGGPGFSVEFPYGEQSSLCIASAKHPHPLYGNGLYLLQYFPVKNMSKVKGINLALAMNRYELLMRPFGYGFGSYVFSDNILHFTSFYPNALYFYGLLINIYFSSAQRAREMSKRLTETDWDDSIYSTSKSSLSRMLEEFE